MRAAWPAAVPRHKHHVPYRLHLLRRHLLRSRDGVRERQHVLHRWLRRVQRHLLQPRELLHCVGLMLPGESKSGACARMPSAAVGLQLCVKGYTLLQRPALIKLECPVRAACHAQNGQNCGSYWNSGGWGNGNLGNLFNGVTWGRR